MEKQLLRPQIYEVPHKAIRNALAQISLLAGNINYNDHKELENFNELFKEIFKMLYFHAEHENNVTLKYLENKIGGSSKHDMEDHEKIESDMKLLEDSLERIVENTAGDNTGAGIDFYEKYCEFHANYLLHMLEEEKVTQPLVWQNFSDEEILDQENEIKSNIPPPEMLIWSKYMMPALNDNIRTQMLKGIKSKAPKEFFDAISNVTESVLPKDVYEKLMSRIN